MNHLLPILVSGSKDNSVKIWDILEHKIVYDLDNNKTVVNSLQISQEIRINFLEIYKRKLLTRKEDIDNSLDSLVQNTVSFTNKTSNSLHLITENVENNVTNYLDKIKDNIKGQNGITKHLKFLESIIPKKQDNHDKNN